ncbi:hypothetical protein SBRCBS47491_001555 [Sporothrix bragantina]|uniref:Cyclase n=1 Tax=Sporothrix bragantina TaxID=671064 RepID=A0ABP0B023_9PEZI
MPHKLHVMTDLPKFEDLPLRKDGPPYNAWGLYGEDDELGRLNLITPETVQRGIRAAEHGIVINLNLPLDRQTSHSNARAGLKHTLVSVPGAQHLDDELSFNTQCSTQWDGFRHFPYKDWPSQGELTFYNGQTLESARDLTDSRNGIHNFANHPITSRAHLLDVPRYLKKNGLPPLVQLDNTTPIDADLLTAVAAFQQTEFLPGDICVLRIGHVEAVFALGRKGQNGNVSANEAEKKVTKFCGVSKAVEVAKWHWDRGIAAVVTDGVAYESSREEDNPIYLHEIFLAGWGMPIGEWFDLRRLAAECDRLGKWTFLFTSMPLNVTGGIASPPNAQAIL